MLHTSPLAWLLPFKLVTDDREPVLTITFMGGAFIGIYIPSVAFWLQVLISIALQCILSALLSIWTFVYIIQPRQKEKTTFSHFLIGYGFLIPLWLVLPRLQLHAFGIHNMVINFCLSGIIPTLNIFHTMEGKYYCVCYA